MSYETRFEGKKVRVFVLVPAGANYDGRIVQHETDTIGVMLEHSNTAKTFFPWHNVVRIEKA